MILNQGTIMKKNILFIMALALSSNTLIANSNIHRVLGITPRVHTKEKIVVPRRKKNYIEPKRVVSKNPQIDKLMKYTKIRKKAEKETSYGLKMGYKISKNFSFSVDVMAQVDKDKSYKIISKEANLQFALSL